MDYTRLGEHLRLAREGAGFSQSEVAGLVDISPAALNQYEMGKRRLEALMLERLARLYGRPVGFFFGDEIVAADWALAVRSMARDSDIKQAPQRQEMLTPRSAQVTARLGRKPAVRGDEPQPLSWLQVFWFWSRRECFHHSPLRRNRSVDP